MGPQRYGDVFGKPLKYATGRKLEGSEEGVAMAKKCKENTRLKTLV